MITYRILLVVSLVINGLLYALISPHGPAVSSASRHSLSDRRLVIRVGFQTPALPPTARDQWIALGLELRADGMPESVVRAWIQAEIDAYYRETKETILPTRKVRDVWEPELTVTLEQRLALAELDREKSLAMFAALGPDPSLADSPLYGALPAETRDRVKRELAYQDAYITAYRENASFMPTTAEREWINSLEGEKWQALSSLLPGKDLETLQMLTSPIAQKVRQTYAAGLALSQEEFKALYDWQTALSGTIGRVAGETIHRALTQSEAQALENELILRVGEERYGQLANFGYRQLSALIDRAGLPASALPTLVQIRDEVTADSVRIADDPSMSATDRISSLQSLAASTRERFATVLGPEATGAAAPVMTQWFGMLDRGMAVVFDRGAVKQRLPSATAGTPLRPSP